MTDTTEATKQKNKFVVIPSNVYNTKVFEIFSSIADKHDGVKAYISNFINKEYKLSYFTSVESKNLSPFTDNEPNVIWTLSYSPRFSTYKRQEDKFLGIEKKQVFASEEAVETYFQEIYDTLDTVVKKKLAQHDSEDN